MSRHAAVDLDFGDDKYSFRLGLNEIEEVEEKCDCGLFEILNHLSEARTFRLMMLRSVLRVGLIGGGMDTIAALRLVNKYVDEKALDENRDVAYSVVLAALQRVHGDELVKRAEDGEGEPGKPEESTSPASTEAPA